MHQRILGIVHKSITASAMLCGMGKPTGDELIPALAELLAQPIRLAESRQRPDQPPLTLADILRTGAFFSKILCALDADGGGHVSPANEELLSVVLKKPIDMPQLQGLLERRFQSGNESPQELQQLFSAVTAFASKPHNIRALMMRILRETLPPGLPGRKRKVSPEQWPVMLARSEALQPTIRALSMARHAAPKRDLTECLQYIAKDYPSTTEFLLKHEARFRQLYADKKLLGQVATEDSGYRLLADAMAGAEFDLSPRYSIQICRTARRATGKRKQARTQQKT
jgi:hypothetical protein